VWHASPTLPRALGSDAGQGAPSFEAVRADLRQALYTPALVTARFNPDLKAEYAQLPEAGKPAKVALDTIMRRRIVLANALLKANRNRTPKIN